MPRRLLRATREERVEEQREARREPRRFGERARDGGDAMTRGDASVLFFMRELRAQDGHEFRDGAFLPGVPRDRERRRRERVAVKGLGALHQVEQGPKGLDAHRSHAVARRRAREEG